ncbi:MAG: hypothetical protein WDM71_02305 [Ferruginibacter sp.]
MRANIATDFKIKFLKFLRNSGQKDVNIYDFIMQYYSTHLSKILLLQLKGIITQLCKSGLISCNHYAHNLIGVQGIDEAYQKKNATCIIKDLGLEYLRTEKFNKTMKIIGAIAAIAALVAILH